MANWSVLKTAVANNINTNGSQAITGQLLQNVLNNIITNVGENATFAGIATLDTNPGAPDGPVFYLATTAGTYPNFNSAEVLDGEAVIFKWNNGAWTKKVTGLATQEKASSSSGGYGVNVTVFGIKGGNHSIETAVKDVKQESRIPGQKITFRTWEDQWETWIFESSNIEDYEKIEFWKQEILGDVQNKPDEEDLTAVEQELKFADKLQNDELYSGLGRVYVRKEIVDGKNVLEQRVFEKTKTRYIIQYDHDLNGNSIIINEGCVLEFQGGSLKNGSIIINDGVVVNGNGAKIESNIIVRGKNITIKDLEIECTGICIYDDDSYDVSGLVVDGCKLRSTGDNCIKIIADNLEGCVDNITIKNTDFTFYRMGIELQNHGTESTRFSGGVISACNFKMVDKNNFLYGYAISLSGWGEHISISECLFFMCYMGVELVGFNYTIITNNKFKYITGTYSIAATNFRRMAGTIITNNTLRDRRLYITNTEDFLIEGNYYSYCIAAIFKSCSRGLIINNRFIYSQYADTGVMLEDTSNTRVEGNQLDMKSSTNFYSVMRAYGSSAKYNVFSRNYISKPDAGVVWDEQNGASGNKFYDYYLESSGKHESTELNELKSLISNSGNTVIDSVRMIVPDYYKLVSPNVCMLLQGSNNLVVSVDNPKFVVRKYKAQANNLIDLDLHFFFRKDNNQYWAKVQLTDASYSNFEPVFNKQGSITPTLTKTTDDEFVYYTITLPGNYNNAIMYGMCYCTSTNYLKWC